MNCATSRSRRSTNCCARMTPVDLLLVEGFKRASASQARNLSAVAGKTASLPRRPVCRRRRVATRSCSAAAAVAAARRCGGDRRFHPRAMTGGRDGAAQRRLLRLWRRADAVDGGARAHRERVTLPVVGTETVAAARGRRAASSRAILSPSDEFAAARQQRRRRLCGRVCRSSRPTRDTILPVGGRAAAGHPLEPPDPNAARRSASLPARRCPTAPTPC